MGRRGKNSEKVGKFRTYFGKGFERNSAVTDVININKGKIRLCFETNHGTHSRISGTYICIITPIQTRAEQKLYTCAGTGGHTEYVRIYGNGKEESTSWTGYGEDGDTIIFDSSFTLEAGKTNAHKIETGSYPQIHHTKALQTDTGRINCTSFVYANGNEYDDWIPAIRLWS